MYLQSAHIYDLRELSVHRRNARWRTNDYALNTCVRSSGASCAAGVYNDYTRCEDTTHGWFRRCRRTGFVFLDEFGIDFSARKIASLRPARKIKRDFQTALRMTNTNSLRLIALDLTSTDSIYPSDSRDSTRCLGVGSETSRDNFDPEFAEGEISTDSGGRHLCVTHVNLLVTIKSLYSILLMPFLISRCIDDTFSISLLLCVSLLLLRAKHQNTRCVSRGPLSWLFCNSTYRHVLSLYVKQVSILYVYEWAGTYE